MLLYNNNVFLMLGYHVFIITGHLSPTETDGDMLGYDLYSSALWQIFSVSLPTAAHLCGPVCTVGKW